MASLLQIAIDRHNAEKLTGPKTLEGIVASRTHSTKHGLTGEGVANLPDDEVGLLSKV